MLALYIIGGLVVLLIAVLSVPIDVRMQVIYPDTPGGKVSIRWLFGLINLPLILGKKRKTAPREAAGKKRGRKRKGPGFKTTVAVLRTRGLSKEIARLIKAVFHRFHVRDFTAHLGIGLEDPADTGMLFAVTGPVAACLRPFIPGDIRLISLPEILAVQGSLGGTMRLWPIACLPPVTRFVFSIPVLLALKSLIVNRWMNRRV